MHWEMSELLGRHVAGAIGPVYGQVLPVENKDNKEHRRSVDLHRDP